MPDCPACGFNNQTGRKGKGEGPIELGYRKMARDLVQQYGSLQSVEYLSHFPNFEINFVFDKHTVYSGRRRGEYDINFLSLGYVGEGPRYAQAFLDELGFSMTSDEIAAINPGAVIKLDNGKVVVEHESIEKAKQPHDQVRNHSLPSQQVAQSANKYGMASSFKKKNQLSEFIMRWSWVVFILAFLGSIFGMGYALFNGNWLIGIISLVYAIWWWFFYS
jgi:hypothetical protein